MGGGNWSPASGEEAFYLLLRYPRWMHLSPRPMAPVFYRLPAEEDRRSGEIGGCGFDGLLSLAYFCPPLTTVLQDQLFIWKEGRRTGPYH
jgi:DNA-binding LacI/PurR family transcriptional regulator